MADKMIKVYPSPKLSPTEYIPGVSPDGTEVPEKRAEALLEAGLVVFAPAKPKAPRKPKAKAKNKPKSPAAPADKPEDPA